MKSFFKEKEILKTLNEKYLSTEENYDAWKEELRKILQSRVLDNSSIREDFQYLRDRRFLNPGFLLEVLKNVDPLAVRFIQRNRWHRRCQREIERKKRNEQHQTDDRTSLTTF